jgi:hypothetical protein
VTEPCWGKLPELPLKPEDIGDELGPDQLILLAKSFIILAHYTQAQQAKCGTSLPDGE